MAKISVHIFAQPNATLTLNSESHYGEKIFLFPHISKSFKPYSTCLHFQISQCDFINCQFTFEYIHHSIINIFRTSAAVLQDNFSNNQHQLTSSKSCFFTAFGPDKFLAQ